MDERQTPLKSENAGMSRYLVFGLGTEYYSIPLATVREVIAMADITAVPQTPAHFKGVMNLRGQVIAVLDLRLKFKMKPDSNLAETAIIILDFQPMSIGVIVDAVNSVVALRGDQISSSPDIESSINADYITGIARLEQKLILILDIEKALGMDARSQLYVNPSTQSKAA